MEKFQVSLDAIENAIHIFEQSTQELEEIYEMVSHAHENLFAMAWTGGAADQFKINSDQWLADLKQYIGCLYGVRDILKTVFYPGVEALDQEAIGLNGIVGGGLQGGSSAEVFFDPEAKEKLFGERNHILNIYRDYLSKLHSLLSKDYFEYSSFSISSEVSSLERLIEENQTMLENLAQALENHQENIKNLERRVCEAFKDISVPARWKTAKGEALGEIISLMEAEGLEDYYYDMKTQNMVFTVNGEQISKCAYGGDPVNMATGNYIYQRRFLQLRGLFPFSFSIMYNSRDAFEGVLGNRWSCNGDLCVLISGKKASILHEDGRQDIFLQNKEGKYLPIDGVQKSFEEKEDGYCYKTSIGIEYTFDLQGRIIKKTDRNGNFLQYEYEEAAFPGSRDTKKKYRRLVRQSSNSGEYLIYFYDSDSHIIKVADHGGREVLFSYDQEGNLLEITGEMREKYVFRYQEDGYLAETINPRGVRSLLNCYDARGRVLSQEYPDGGKISYQIDEEKKSIRETERNQSQTEYFYDGRYRTHKISRPYGEEKFTYNAQSQPVMHVDFLGNCSLTEYDAMGRPIAYTDKNNDRIEYTYFCYSTGRK